jgi:hypothetical protein
MANLIRGILGRMLLVVLALVAVGSAYVVFVQIPVDLVFWKIAFSLVFLAVTLVSALLSSLTLGTRYVIVGVLGMAASSVSAISSISSLWTGDSAGSGIAGIPTTPAEALTSYVGSPTDGSPIGAGYMIIIALAILALPLINVILYFAYESNPVGETLGLVTVAAIIGNSIIVGVSTANESGGPDTLKWTVFLGIVAVVGIIGTPVAASFDSDATNYSSRHGVHYDIQSEGELPSALTESFQAKRQATHAPAPVQDDPPMPQLDYRQ